MLEGKVRITKTQIPKNWFNADWSYFSAIVDGYAYVSYELMFPLGSTLDWKCDTCRRQ